MADHISRWSRRPWTLLSVLVFIAAVAAIFLHQSMLNMMPPCLFHRITGWHCPGCGGRRCVMMLAQGRWLDALHMNALVIVLALGFLLLLCRETWREITQRGGEFVMSPRLGWSLVVLIVGFWVLRNLPFPPFVWLAPQPL
jgi:hypothetical protein